MSTATGKAPSILTVHGARKLTGQIRDTLALADDLLVRAFVGRIWEASTPAYGSWEAWCDGELPELRALNLRAAPRLERVAKLDEAGATIAQIVKATGASLGTVHRDLVKIHGSSRHRAPKPVAPVDPTEERNWQVAVRVVAAAGIKGMTCLEFEDKTGWRHGAASAAMNAAEKKGHIRRDGRTREGYGTYMAT